MVEIECLVCQRTIKIPQFIDTDNYDGQLACQECGSLLHVKVDTHGHSPWHFTVQASLDLNPGVTAISHTQ